MAHRSRKPAKRPPSNFGLAAQKGIFPLRRKIAPESYEVLREARRELRKEFQSLGRSYAVNDVAVTLIGMSRMNNGNLLSAPRSRFVKDQVSSCSEPMHVSIGGIALFGRGKLGFHIVNSPNIHREVEKLEGVYEDHGFELVPYKPDEFDEDGEEGVYRPHLTLVNLYQQGEAILEDERARSRYDHLAGLQGESIWLLPVDVPIIAKKR